MPFILRSIYRKKIQIYKYSYETKTIKNIGKIDVISFYYKSMKYFYNPLNKQEYFLIINYSDEIEKYLIQNENNLKLIQKFNYINDGDIYNNSSNNRIIIIDDDIDSVGEEVLHFQSSISYLIMETGGGSMSSLDNYNTKSNNIYTFKDG